MRKPLMLPALLILGLVTACQPTAAPGLSAASPARSTGVPTPGAVQPVEGASVQVVQTQVITGRVPRVAADRYLGVLAKVCVTQDSYLSTQPWTVVGPTGPAYPPESSLGTVSTTMAPYPDSATTERLTGSCVQGWLYFEVPAADTDLLVRYSVGDGSAGNPVQTLSWQA